MSVGDFLDLRKEGLKEARKRIVSFEGLARAVVCNCVCSAHRAIGSAYIVAIRRVG